jgi:DNA-binding CsgD family transcriptional regulator
MGKPLQNLDWPQIFAAEPGVSVAVISLAGEIEYCNAATYAMYRIKQPPSDEQAVQLSDAFHPEFVSEKLKWIANAIEANQPLRGNFIYNGRHLIVSMYPLTDRTPPAVLCVTIHNGRGDPGEMRSVSSEWIDLGDLSPLSQRELEVLILIGQGNSVPEVGKLLFRSPRTIERHKQTIGRKLGATSIADIVKVVANAGLTYDDTKLMRLT